MRKLLNLGLFAAIFLFAEPVIAQDNKGLAKKSISPSNPLVGTWRLVVYADFDSTTKAWLYPYGKNPRGYITYTKNFLLNVNVSAETPLGISQDSAKRSPMHFYGYLRSFAFGYFGTYAVDYEKMTLTHHPLGGSYPWSIGKDNTRPFAIKGDSLFIGDLNTHPRIAIRAD